MGNIVDYASLQSGMDAYLGQTLFQSRYPDFIDFFERCANRRLREKSQETSTNLTTSGGSVALPSDFIEQIRVTRLTTIPQDLQWLEPSQAKIVYPDQIQVVTPPQYAIPSAFFTVEVGNIIVRPKDDASQIQLVYYAKIPALSITNTTNWLLTSHPDLYLFGSMAEAEMFGVNDDRVANWKARRDELFEELKMLTRAYHGTGAIRVPGPTP